MHTHDLPALDASLAFGEIDVAGRNDRSATGTAAPLAVIGERAEQADRPARRAAAPGDRGKGQERKRDRANDRDQDDREHAGEPGRPRL